MSINTAPVFVTLPKLSTGKVRLNVNNIVGWTTTSNGYSKINLLDDDACSIELAATFDEVSDLVSAAILAGPGGIDHAN